MTNTGEEVAQVVVAIAFVSILSGLVLGHILIPTDWGMFIGMPFGAILGFSISFGYQKFKLEGAEEKPEEAMRF